jgi:linoleoyl-CoA desaturase
VQRTIIRLAFPGGEERPKAPPYVSPEVDEEFERMQQEIAPGVPAFP